MESRTIGNSQIVVDDGALHAATVPRQERIPVYDPNGLHDCDGVTFSREQKRRALGLLRPL